MRRGEQVDPFVFEMGVDENGLGPKLGPLIVTSVSAQMTGVKELSLSAKKKKEAPLSYLRSCDLSPLSHLLGDSKKLVHFGGSELGEAWARIMVQRHHLYEAEAKRDTLPVSKSLEMAEYDDVYDEPSQLLNALFGEQTAELKRLCEPGFEAQCWPQKRGGEKFEASDELMKEVHAACTYLEKMGIRLFFAASAMICTKRLNLYAESGQSRFDVDLKYMQKLVFDQSSRITMFTKKMPTRLLVCAGKVGGYRYYVPHLTALRHLKTVNESKDESVYELDPVLGLSEPISLHFLKDADDLHPLVSMASLIGKWLRDFFTLRVVKYHSERESSLNGSSSDFFSHEQVYPRWPSGYQDPITAQFIERTKRSRAKDGFPEICFERKKKSEKKSKTGR